MIQLQKQVSQQCEGGVAWCRLQGGAAPSGELTNGKAGDEKAGHEHCGHVYLSLSEDTVSSSSGRYDGVITL